MGAGRQRLPGSAGTCNGRAAAGASGAAGRMTAGGRRATYRVGVGIRIWSPGWMAPAFSVGFHA